MIDCQREISSVEEKNFHNINQKVTSEYIRELFEKPFFDIISEARKSLALYFDPNEIQISSLLNVKAGGCPEDCSYCSQSIFSDSGIKATPFMSPEEISKAVKKSKDSGADRFCIAAAWRGIKNRDLSKIANAIGIIKSYGMESCASLGLMNYDQAVTLKNAGLDYYNHNIDCSEEFYSEIITTRSFEERIETLHAANEAGLKLCCGLIIGMGESKDDIVSALSVLSNMNPQPGSVPLNLLVRIPGTPMENLPPVDPFMFIRIVAIARIIMPKSRIRLSAGRESMSDEYQALCIMAGANSIFLCDKLLTVNNCKPDQDVELIKKLGLKILT